MFNIFKTKNQETSKVEVKEEVSNKYPQVVQDIHNEFFTAGDNLLSEAKSLLLELENKDVSKGKRLAALGFTKTREAMIAIQTDNKLAITKEIGELVVYYQRNYPNNKFITEDQVKLICKKYGLVLGEISAYKGFVPETKIDLIENFKLKKDDKEVIELVNTCVQHISLGYFDKKNVDKYDSYLLAAEVNMPTDPFLKSIKDKALLLGIKEDHIYIQRGNRSGSLKICAPLKDMELSSRQQVVDYKIIDVPDPVVLQPVKCGYLIVCAWGDEASDEIIVNQTMN